MSQSRLFARAPLRGTLLALGGMAAGLLVIPAGSAQAQFFPWQNVPTYSGRAYAYGEMPAPAMIAPGEIYRMLADRGYRIDGGLRRSGRVYIANVTDSFGQPKRLVIDAYEGDILRRFDVAPSSRAAELPQPPTHAELSPPSPAYPPYPGVNAPVPATPRAEAPRIVPGIDHPSSLDRPSRAATRRSPTPKTMATRETAPTKQPTRAKPPTAAIAPQPAPAHDSVTPAPSAKTPSPTVAAAPAADPAPAPAAALAPAPKPAAKPAASTPKTDGPGYANGVPINPLD